MPDAAGAIIVTDYDGGENLSSARKERMNQEVLRTRVESIAADPNASPNEQVLAKAVVELLGAIQRNVANEQWLSSQIASLAKKCDIDLGAPPR